MVSHMPSSRNYELDYMITLENSLNCGLFLCQINRCHTPIKEALLSGPWADDRDNLITGLVIGELGYAIYPENLLTGIDQVLARLFKAYNRNSGTGNQHNVISRLTLLTTATILLPIFLFFFCFSLLPFSQ
jgi:hypothetical protein